VTKTLTLPFLVVVTLGVGAGLAAAQTQTAPAKPAQTQPAPADVDKAIEQLRKDARTEVNALIGANMSFTSEEAAKFWPLYDEYQKKLTAVNDRLVALIKDYTTSFSDMADDHALRLAEQYLAVEEDRVKVRREYLPQFAKILPGRKVARFLQIENKMDAVVRYDLAEEIPVIDEAPAR
jgi:hypothetical protein